MPTLIKATWIFEQGGQGWTESLFNNADTSNLKDFTKGKAKNYADKRIKLCGLETTIKAIRCSVEKDTDGKKVQNDSYLDYVNIVTPDQNSSVDEPNESEDPSTALQVIFRDENSTKRKLIFLRGIWDRIVVKGKFVPSVGDWQTNFNSWTSTVLQDGWGWQASKRGEEAKVTNYTEDTTSQQVTLTLNKSIFPAEVGDAEVVRVRGINTKSALNGALLVTGQSAQTCKTVKPIAVGPFVSSGYLRRYTKEFIKAVNIDAQKIVSRKPGSPLLVIRGRSPVRVRT